jgi:hypothetical protein
MADCLIQYATVRELADVAREITGDAHAILGSEIASKIRDGFAVSIRTPSVTDWSYFFYEGRRSDLYEKCMFESGVEFNNCFYNCNWITIAKPINLRGIKQDGTTAHCRNIFSGCTNLTSVDLELNSDSSDALLSSNLPRAFYNCSALEHVGITGKIKVVDSNLNFAYSPYLSIDSLLSISNAILSNAGEGGTPHTVYLGDPNIKKLTEDQQADFTNKNIKLG